MSLSRFHRSGVYTAATLVLFAFIAGCAPEQWVIQHAAKGQFTRGYKYIGIDVERANVRLRAWNNDSVAIAVNMLATVRSAYSFAVDSIDDTLLLIGKFRGAAELVGSWPEAVLDIPGNANVTVSTGGSVSVLGLDGPLSLSAVDSVSVVNSPKNTLFARSSAGRVILEFPSGFGGELDLESGPSGMVEIDNGAFRGTRQRGLAKGTYGAGGPRIGARGMRGVEVQIRGGK